MFDNSFTDEHRFDYFDPNDNEDDEMIEENMKVNIENDIDDKIVPYIHKSEVASRSIFIVSHY